MRTVMLLAAAVVLASCSVATAPDPRAAETSRETYRLLLGGDMFDVEAKMKPRADTLDQIEAMRAVQPSLPKTEPIEVRSLRPVPSRFFDGDDSYESIRTTDTYVYATKTVTVYATMVRPIEDTSDGLYGPMLLTADVKPKGDGVFDVEHMRVVVENKR